MSRPTCCIRRLNATVTTLESLERYQGHFLNWYDTASLAPLHPRYVSTVDSGNLAGALIALSQGLIQLEENPQTPAQRLAGLADAAGLLAAASSSSDARLGPRHDRHRDQSSGTRHRRGHARRCA